MHLLDEQIWLFQCIIGEHVLQVIQEQIGCIQALLEEHSWLPDGTLWPGT